MFISCNQVLAQLLRQVNRDLLLLGTKLYTESWYKVSYPGSDVLDLKYERPVK